MGGGQTLTFDRYLTAGTSIVVNETFEDIYQKESSSMGLLTFLETSTEYLTAAGDCAIECEKTTIVADRQ
jgi:3-isopropylmalate dehydratase small subunit